MASQNTFLIVVWIVSLIGFLFFPLCFSANRRRLWRERIRTRTWNVPSHADDSDDGSGIPHGTDDDYRFALSKEQEDEIRESFVSEKLKLFTKTLSESDIHAETTDIDNTNTQPTNDTTIDATDKELYGEDTFEGNDSLPTVTKTTSPIDAQKNTEEDGGSTDECCSSDDSVDGVVLDHDDIDCFDGTVTLPMPGACCLDTAASAAAATSEKSSTVAYEREVPNGCSICLCAFEADSKVTWSSNPDCNHAFHSTCVLNWLLASGKKHLRRQRRNENRSSAVHSYSNDPIQQITDFPMLCPCCRQDFVMIVQDTDDSSVGEKETTERVVVQGSDENV